MSGRLALPPELQHELQTCIFRILDQLLKHQGHDDGSTISEGIVAPWQIDDALHAVSLGAEAAARSYGRSHNCTVAINTLPIEMLCQILLAVPAPSWCLAHVCQHWRRAIVADPLQVAYLTSRSSSKTDLMSEALEYYLPRVKDGSTTLDLRVDTDGTASGLGRVIDLHLYHLRQLFVVVEPTALHDLPYGLRAPAPRLEVAHICHYNQAVRYTPVTDLFSGYAPRLHTLRLHRVAVSVDALRNFTNLKALTYSAYDEITVADITTLLHISPVLEYLTIGAGTFLVGGTSQPARFEHPASLKRLYFADEPTKNSEPIRELITACSDWPLDVLGLWTTSEESVKWLAESFPSPQKASLTSDTGVDFFLEVSSLLEQGDSGRATRTYTRTARGLRAHHFAPLMGLPGLMAQLRELTVSEAVLSATLLNEGLSFLPVAPLLEHLSIELALHGEYYTSPSSTWKETFAGLFQLGLEADTGWRCPSLRTLTLAADPATACPAVVSAHEVAVFLSWHLHVGTEDDKLPTLVLDGVTLHESEGSVALEELMQRVSTIEVRPHEHVARPDRFAEMRWVTPI
ncbi:hypothetical protein AURDEDRAFT_159350 [Auricularia subglabra TFB-10046 SS5]|nr:hypothetical protein AURDEDRAFT_159350 [Auricularia subglabra TFB-10046 SS5]